MDLVLRMTILHSDDFCLTSVEILREYPYPISLGPVFNVQN